MATSHDQVLQSGRVIDLDEIALAISSPLQCSFELADLQPLQGSRKDFVEKEVQKALRAAGVPVSGSTPPPQVALKLRMPKQEVKAEQPHVEPATGHNITTALPVQPAVDTIITASPVDPATADTQVDADMKQASLTDSADAEMPPAVETPAHEQGDVDMGPPAVETAPTQTEMPLDQGDADMPQACAGEMPPPSTTPVKPKPSGTEQTPVDPPKPADAPVVAPKPSDTQVPAPIDPPKPSDTQVQAPVDPPKPSDAVDSTQVQAPVDPPKPSADDETSAAAEPRVRHADTMSTMVLGQWSREDLLEAAQDEPKPSLVAALAEKYFGLHTEGGADESMDAAEMAEASSLLTWAAHVLGPSCSSERRDVALAEAEEMAGESFRGSALLPHESKLFLAPAVESVNEALCRIREFKGLEDSVKSGQEAVHRQVEKARTALSQQHAKGDISDDVHTQKLKELYEKIQAKEDEVCTKINEAIAMILKAWDNLKPQPALLSRIDEHCEQPMEVDAMEQEMMAELDAQLLATTLNEDANMEPPPADESSQGAAKAAGVTDGLLGNSEIKAAEGAGGLSCNSDIKAAEGAGGLSCNSEIKAAEGVGGLSGNSEIKAAEGVGGLSGNSEIKAAEGVGGPANVPTDLALVKPSGIKGAVGAALDKGLIQDILLRRPDSFQLQESALALKDGESEEERLLRIAHNIYMKFNRSHKSAKSLDEMFIEYLRCDGKWMESNLIVKQVTSKGQLVEGVECYMRYMDLKKKEGVVTAKLIRDEKRLLQENLEQNPDPDVLPFIMAHPDLPGSEDWELVRVFESAKITKSSARKSEATLSTDMDLDGEQTRAILPCALGLGNGQLPQASSSGSNAALPVPAGLRSLGSAESLQKEQDELKKLRKAGKGGFANQVRTKAKQVEDKIKELDDIQSSAPLRNGYHDELELHRSSLKEAVEQLQADDLEDPAEQQKRMEMLATLMKNYSDSANMIKKKVVPSINLDLSFVGAVTMLQQSHKVPISYVQVPMRASVTDDTVIQREANREYWAHMVKHTDWAASHPCSQYPETSIPTFLYGDDVKFNRQEKLTCTYLGFILADKKGLAMRTHFPIFIVRVVTSLNAAIFGFTPARPILNADGTCEGEGVPEMLEQPLVVDNGEVVRFPLCELRGDWKFYKDIWPGVSKADQLKSAYAAFRAWCRERKIVHSQPLFQPKHLRGKDGEVELAAKAYNVRVVTSWLADTVTELVHQEGYDTEELLLLAQCMHFLSELMNNLEIAPRYLQDNHIQAISYAADASLAAYLGLAAQCASIGLPYFPIRPKLHAVQEMVFFAAKERGYNFRHYHTFLAEDMNGRLVGIASRVHSRALERSTLQRYYLWLIADDMGAESGDDEM
ncbi:unnamed protein product [Symbiodinium sp. CCMP2592]|nr:unnamed protein product [Symbiodinium sp. CCMP2592]